MDSIVTRVEKYMDECVDSFIQRIVCKYDNVKLSELRELWKNVGNEKEPVKNKAEKETTTKHTGCLYVFSKGKRKDEECGKNQVKGSKFCSAHKKYEGKKPAPEKKKLPKSKKASTTQIRARKHPTLGVYYHVGTNLVAKSKTKTKVIVGKIVDNTIVPLTKEDIEKCKEQKLTYEISKELEEPKVGVEANSLKDLVEDEKNLTKFLGVNDSGDELDLGLEEN